MPEVNLTTKEAARALKLNYFTVTRFAASGKFPNAWLREGSRRKGWRIPEGDVLAYALGEGHERLRHARDVVEELRAALVSAMQAS